MANTPQAKKRILRSANRAEINGARKRLIQRLRRRRSRRQSPEATSVAAESAQGGPARKWPAAFAPRRAPQEHCVARKMSRASRS